MMMPSRHALVLSHVAFENLGSLEAPLKLPVARSPSVDAVSLGLHIPHLLLAGHASPAFFRGAEDASRRSSSGLPQTTNAPQGLRKSLLLDEKNAVQPEPALLH